MDDGHPGLAYDDIAIRSFHFEHDTIIFGLIIEDGHGTDWAELYPDRTASAAASRRSARRRLSAGVAEATGLAGVIRQ